MDEDEAVRVLGKSTHVVGDKFDTLCVVGIDTGFMKRFMPVWYFQVKSRAKKFRRRKKWSNEFLVLYS